MFGHHLSFHLFFCLLRAYTSTVFPLNIWLLWKDSYQRDHSQN